MTTRPLIGISAFACISALAVILLATQTKFFSKKYEMDDLKDITEFSELKFCASIMFRACVIMSSNCFSVSAYFYLDDPTFIYLSKVVINKEYRNIVCKSRGAKMHSYVFIL